VIALPGYQILALIHEGANSLVYRGIREQDNKAVILKLLKEDYPTPLQLARHKQEYEITRNLNLDGVVRAEALLTYQNTWVIIFEDFGGQSLTQLINERKFTSSEFLSLAIKIAESLGEIHAANIIHKDIKPSNIFFNQGNGQVKIIDFGISTVLTRENPTIKNPNVLEGTLAYISPEQTGRMNRSLDYRTDFYSLGATFYELLTHQLPFDTTDAMELVHSHIARQPMPPHEINPDIPKTVSDIVMKLLAKTAEERYQSAWGLKADLQECLTQLQNNSQIAEFPLGHQDISDKFQIPQKLYGREQEVEMLMNAFDRVSQPPLSKGGQGGVEMMLIAGYCGIGKSALVQELYKPITRQRGYFISGKFNQFKGNIPYSAIVSAFSDLVRQLLTESEAQLQTWREKLLAAMGPNGQVIIDVIPEVELIVGQQPPVAELGPAESQNRFNLVFQNFIRVFCQPEHPLVIFLDDLQWSKSATLKLIELMMTDEQMQYLLLIGAYRDNEVSPTYPLMMTLDALRKQGISINQITLAPLRLEHITDLIAETLHSDTESVKPLAELVMRKTQGNPFFVNQFLKTLYQENLLFFNPPQSGSKGGWQWNIAQIEAIGITDNVVELMSGKLKKLPARTQQVLCLAACVGNEFDLNTLSLIHEKSACETFQDLWIAIQEGLILPTSELEVSDAEYLTSNLLIFNYKFLHDRVQQSAYALIDAEIQKAAHLRIGRLLLANLSREDQEERIFELVDHLNLGREWITDEQEQIELVKLNLAAGQKAKDATAYTAAMEYLTAGMQEVNDNSWSQHYDLTFALHKERAKLEYLNGNLEQSEALIYLTLARAKSAIEKAELYNLLIVQYTMLAKYEQAIEAGRKALSFLGIDLPEEGLQTALEVELRQAKENLGDRAIASLLTEPEMTVLKKKAAVKLLMNLDPPAYFINQELYPVIVLKMANISLKYGPVSESAKAYTTYGIILGSLLGDYQSGYEFALLGVKLSDRFNDLAQKCKACNMLANHVIHWVKPIKCADTFNQEGYKAGLESGEFQFAGYILMHQRINEFFEGQNLDKILEKIPNSLLFSNKTQNHLAINSLLAYQLPILNLSGITAGKFNFNKDEISEEQYLEKCKSDRDSHSLCLYYSVKSQVLYLYDQPAEALRWAVEAKKLLPFILGIVTEAEHNFYYSLSLAALYPEASESEKKQYWEQLEANQKQMKIWADNCPENFLHKYLMVAAQMARISGKELEAMDLCDRAIGTLRVKRSYPEGNRAIESAREQQFIQDEALANELAAKFWLGKGKEEFAELYMRKAHYGYQLWGAKRKVEDLEEKYPQLLARKSATARGAIKDTSPTTTKDTTDSGSSSCLDLATVMKASQAISGEIVLDKLLSQLMKILIENAGAQKGFLILESKGQLLIEAEGSVDQDNVTVLQSIAVGATASVPLPVAIINYVARTRESVVLNDATREGQFINDPYIEVHQPKSILCAPLINQGKLSGIIYLENNLTTGAFTPDRLEMVNLLSTQAAISIDNARLYRNMEDLNKAYFRFVPRQFLDFLEKESIVEVELGDQVQKEMSVLFADIRNFTSMSENMTPAENFKFINSYLSCMEPAITENHGFIDKYIGDGIMALFSGGADDAVKAGISMLQRLAEYNQYRVHKGYSSIRIGIGINTGSLMLGTVGGHSRMDGTVISDTVNLASRIEGLTKNYGVSLLISDQTFSQLQNADQYSLRTIGKVKVRGKSAAVTIYEVFDADAAEIREGKLVTKQEFEQALFLYNQGAFKEAAQGFQACLDINPKDTVAQIYLEGCQGVIKSLELSLTRVSQSVQGDERRD
jgi:predicted ATPase/class 3 adenylate cyclase/GAF domain-containing protein/tRNA A-37 threonylcarbamoyl transferase component Bud32